MKKKHYHVSFPTTTTTKGTEGTERNGSAATKRHSDRNPQRSTETQPRHQDQDHHQELNPNHIRVGADERIASTNSITFALSIGARVVVLTRTVPEDLQRMRVLRLRVSTGEHVSLRSDKRITRIRRILDAVCVRRDEVVVAAAVPVHVQRDRAVHRVFVNVSGGSDEGVSSGLGVVLTGTRGRGEVVLATTVPVDLQRQDVAGEDIAIVSDESVSGAKSILLALMIGRHVIVLSAVVPVRLQRDGARRVVSLGPYITRSANERVTRIRCVRLSRRVRTRKVVLATGVPVNVQRDHVRQRRTQAPARRADVRVTRSLRIVLTSTRSCGEVVVAAIVPEYVKR